MASVFKAILRPPARLIRRAAGVPLLQQHLDGLKHMLHRQQEIVERLGREAAQREAELLAAFQRGQEQQAAGLPS